MLSHRSRGFCDALVGIGVLAFALMAMGACGGEVTVGSPAPGESGGFGGWIVQSGCTLDGSANVPAKLSGPLPSGGAVTLAVDQLLVRRMGRSRGSSTRTSSTWRCIG